MSTCTLFGFTRQFEIDILAQVVKKNVSVYVCVMHKYRAIFRYFVLMFP